MTIFSKKISGIRSDGNILPIPMMTCERYELEGGDILVVECSLLYRQVQIRGLAILHRLEQYQLKKIRRALPNSLFLGES